MSAYKSLCAAKLSRLLAYIPEGFKDAFFALFSGAFAASGFTPAGWSFCAALGLAGLFWTADQQKTVWRSAGMGFFWGLTYFSLGLGWTYHSMHVVGGLPSWLSVMGVLVLAALLSVVPALACAMASAVTAYATKYLGRRPSSLWRLMFIFPLCWVAGEVFRAESPMGFGWLSMGYAFSDTMVAGWAPVTGIYGVSLVIALFAGGLPALLFERRTQEVALLPQAVLTRSMTAILLGAIAVGGFAFNSIPWSENDRTLQVRLVQPNLLVKTRVTPLEQSQRLDRVVAMSMSAPLGAGLDLIVWPESVFAPSFEKLSVAMQDAPSRVARTSGATVIFNAFHEPSSRQYLNSLWVAKPGDPAPVVAYSKRHLVPFGEYVPPGFRGLIDAMQIPMADQTAGERPRHAFSIESGSVSAALTICYENMFSEELRDWWRVGNPGLIVNSANLGWFAPFASYQYTRMSMMRAKETARPVIAAVNNGSSVVISPAGRIERFAPQGAQNLDIALMTTKGDPTPVVRWGLLPLLGLWILLALIATYLLVEEKRPQSVIRKQATLEK